jgi:hypothetical protein
VIKFELFRRLELAPVRAEEKKSQGTKPVRANDRYGTPSEGNRANDPNTTAKIRAVRSGWRTAQLAPRTVWA